MFNFFVTVCMHLHCVKHSNYQINLVLISPSSILFLPCCIYFIITCFEDIVFENAMATYFLAYYIILLFLLLNQSMAYNEYCPPQSSKSTINASSISDCVPYAISFYLLTDKSNSKTLKPKKSGSLKTLESKPGMQPACTVLPTVTC